MILYKKLSAARHLEIKLNNSYVKLLESEGYSKKICYYDNVQAIGVCVNKILKFRNNYENVQLNISSPKFTKNVKTKAYG